MIDKDIKKIEREQNKKKEVSEKILKMILQITLKDWHSFDKGEHNLGLVGKDNLMMYPVTYTPIQKSLLSALEKLYEMVDDPILKEESRLNLEETRDDIEKGIPLPDFGVNSFLDSLSKDEMKAFINFLLAQQQCIISGMFKLEHLKEVEKKYFKEDSR